MYVSTINCLSLLFAGLVIAGCGAEQTPGAGTAAVVVVSAPVVVEADETQAPSADATPTADTRVLPDDAPDGDVAPAGTELIALSIAVSIRARHNEDLPTAEELAAMPDAAASLLWLERNATHMFERTRALTLMRHTPTDAVFARLDAVASSEDEAEVARRAARASLAALGREPTVSP